MSYEAIKNKWRNKNCVILSERSQSEKTTLCLTFLKNQNGRQEKEQWFLEKEEGEISNWSADFFFRAVKLFL